MSEHIENPDNQVEDSTAVGQVDVNIDEIFGMPGAENVMLPAEEEKPKSMFSKESVDTSFFDKKSNSEKSEDESKPEEIESAIKKGFISSNDTEKRGAPEYPPAPATPKPSRTISVYY
jgi:hypothetical protein